MELGQRLRQERIRQGLSQRQLCGDVITRNMLSQIENGSARPSMDTLSYLSARLGKPVSYFLEGQSASVPNLEVIRQARLLYREQNWTQLLRQLQQYQEEDGLFDDERWLLQAMCLMELAQQALQEDSPYYAQQLLEETEQAGRSTAYYTAEHERRRLILLAEATGQPVCLPGEDRALLLRAQWLLENGKPEQAAVLLDCCEELADPRWNRLRAEAAYAMKEFSTAILHYRKAEETEPALCMEKLELCFQAIGDYKMAYEYACKRRNQP